MASGSSPSNPGSGPLSPPPTPGIGVGTWAWGNQFLWGYEPGQDGQLQACFRRAVELGLHFFDTADSYGTGRYAGRSELLLGRCCAGLDPSQRERITVATKLAPFPWRLGRQGFRRAFAASRERLQGKLDRVQLHWSTASYLPWQELPLLDGLADLVQEGQVAAMGVSNLGPERLSRLDDHLRARGIPLVSVQVQLSLLAPEATAPGGLAALCRERGIELIAYSPLALGLLTRTAGSLPSDLRGPRRWLARRQWEPIQPLLQAIAEIASGKPGGPAAVALNWCRAHGALPIVGLRSPAQAETAAAALRWQLDASSREALDSLARSCVKAGGSMPRNPFQSR